MKDGPSIAPVAALAGDPARANMLCALLAGQALTASELAQEAGITPQTASSHLSKLSAGGLIMQVKQGRHRYFRLSGPDVALMLETMLGVAQRNGQMRTRPGPKDPELRKARVCYDHLAGEMGVMLFDGLTRNGLLAARDNRLSLTRKGETFMDAFGVALDDLAANRRPLCRSCLDWSMRRSHLAGALGAALLARVYALGWAKPVRNSRVVSFTPRGERQFRATFAGA